MEIDNELAENTINQINEAWDRAMDKLENNIINHITLCLTEFKNEIIQKVIMSQKLFEEQQKLFELYDKLDEAEEQSCVGKHRPFHEAMAELKERTLMIKIKKPKNSFEG